jgi:hypothetical protein
MNLHQACEHPFVPGNHGSLALGMFDFISTTWNYFFDSIVWY